jgi:hypothetical protein
MSIVSFTTTLVPPAGPESPLIEKLLDWLVNHWAKPTVTASDIYTYGPNAVRDREVTLELAKALVKRGWLTPLKTRRRDMQEWRIFRGDTDEYP